MTRPWVFLIHQIPPKPLYLRAKIRQRLAGVGAVALKNSVYVLPATDDTLEDFQWIAEEVVSGGGQAWISKGELVGGIDDAALVASFQDARESDYAAVRDELAELAREITAKSPTPSDAAQSALNRLRERVAQIHSIDFFESPTGQEVSKMIRNLDKKLARTTVRRSRVPKSVKGKTWVTRAGIKIDRIASAWLILRHIDPDARFRFIDASRWDKNDKEIAFDIVGGDYSHEADRCTFETLVTKFGVKDRAVTEISEIVHDIDLKDGKFGRTDAVGIQLLIQGLVSAHPADTERLERGLALLDDLAQSFAAGGGSSSGSRARKKTTKKSGR